MNVIRIHRQLQNLTPCDPGQKIGLDQSVISKTEKGIIRIVTEVKGVKTYRVQEYLDKNTGHFGIDTFNEEGNWEGGVGGYIPDFVMSALKNTDKKKEQPY